jgi:hypothetical protein
MSVPGSDSFRLVMRRGPTPNQVFDLSKENVTIGRDITNDIVINDPEVSRHHLRFTRGGDGYTMEDLGSTNGTFINGQRMTGSRPLRPGDMIGLGETVTLAYEPASSPTVASAPSSGAPAAGPTVQTPLQRPEGGASQPFGPGASQPYQAGAGGSGQSQSYSPTTSGQSAPPPSPSQSYSPPPASGQSQQQYPQPAPPSGASQQVQGQPSYPYGSGSSGYSQPNAPYTGTGQPVGATGYGEYDPYAVPEATGNNTTRIVAIGCAALTVFCCCGTLASAVIIDQLCLYQSVPLLYNVIRALGYVAVCP